VALWYGYYEGMADLEERGLLIRPKLDPLAEINGHIFAFRVDPTMRDKVIRTLRARGIESTFHFVPLHSSPYGQNVLGWCPSDLPITERVAASLVRLPLHNQMTVKDVDIVLEQLAQVLTE
jgi:dTDP-4-amino-4,6-dideoxygalactose transaminase